MLNIPETVKVLFKLDSVRKNFRVQFPNGELNDITNENVVQESVRFTESISSQDVLKFGLTEASVIEFETVGIANMYGMTIKCYCEIDTTSLTAAELTEIQSGDYDGELVLEANSDLGYGFYRVPYGTFRVESCPRNHGAMTHRKVTAYTVIGRKTLQNPFERVKSEMLMPGNTYSPNAYLLTLSGLGYGEDGFLEQQGFTKTELTSPVSVSGTRNTLTVPKTDETLITLEFRVDLTAHGKRTSSSQFSVELNKLHSVELNGGDYSTVIADMVSSLDEYGVAPSYQPEGGSATVTTYDSLESLVKIGIARCYTAQLAAYGIRLDTSKLIYPTLHYSYVDSSASLAGAYQFDEDNYAIYPLREWAKGKINAVFTIPHAASIKHVTSGAESSTIATLYNRSFEDHLAHVYSFTESASYPDYTLTFSPTLQQKPLSLMLYSFANAYSLNETVNSFLELMAAFGKPERDGTYSMLRLSSSNPVQIARENYEECWWNEFDVQPIGTVRFAWGEDGAANTSVYEFGTGESVYDMTDNYVLQHMASASEDSIKALLDEMFIPNISAVVFTPTELDMQGWPFLESGDALQITAEDGTVVNTFALRHELSGIQALVASIESQGGEIIDSEEEE